LIPSYRSYFFSYNCLRMISVYVYSFCYWPSFPTFRSFLTLVDFVVWEFPSVEGFSSVVDFMVYSWDNYAHVVVESWPHCPSDSFSSHITYSLRCWTKMRTPQTSLSIAYCLSSFLLCKHVSFITTKITSLFDYWI